MGSGAATSTKSRADTNFFSSTNWLWTAGTFNLRWRIEWSSFSDGFHAARIGAQIGFPRQRDAVRYSIKQRKSWLMTWILWAWSSETKCMTSTREYSMTKLKGFCFSSSAEMWLNQTVTVIKNSSSIDKGQALTIWIFLKTGRNSKEKSESTSMECWAVTKSQRCKESC